MTTENSPLDVETFRRFCGDVNELCGYLTVIGISELMRRIHNEVPALIDRLEQTEAEIQSLRQQLAAAREALADIEEAVERIRRRSTPTSPAPDRPGE